MKSYSGSPKQVVPGPSRLYVTGHNRDIKKCHHWREDFLQLAHSQYWNIAPIFGGVILLQWSSILAIYSLHDNFFMCSVSCVELFVHWDLNGR